ncbi:MAG: hypothetical protein ACRCT8_02325 [Lacipirellulaceae bacterium]
MTNTRSLIAGIAALFACLPAANAVMVGVEYRDQSVVFPDSGGPWWRGVVDTTANTLTIRWWTELPASQAFAQPTLVALNLSAAPLVWPAVDANNLPYDVPDSFGAGPNPFAVGLDWAFISPVLAQDVTWTAANLSGQPVPVTFSNPAAGFYYPGWGGSRTPVSLGPGLGFAFVNDVAWTQTSMPQIPLVQVTNGASLASAGPAPSTGAVVTPWTPPTGGGVDPSAVPEPALVGFWALATGIVAASAGRRRR